MSLGAPSSVLKDTSEGKRSEDVVSILYGAVRADAAVYEPFEVNAPRAAHDVPAPVPPAEA